MPDIRIGCKMCGAEMVSDGGSTYKCPTPGCSGSARQLRTEAEMGTPAEKVPQPKAKDKKPAVVMGNTIRDANRWVGMTWKFDTGLFEHSKKAAESEGLKVTEVTVVCNGTGYEYSMKDFLERLGITCG